MVSRWAGVFRVDSERILNSDCLCRFHAEWYVVLGLVFPASLSFDWAAISII